LSLTISTQKIDGAQFLVEFFSLVLNARSRQSLFRRVTGHWQWPASIQLQQEKLMRPQIRVGALALALLGCVSFAGAQTPSDPPEKFNLSQSKERMVSQGLAREPAQSAPGYQGQVGSKPPDPLASKPLPNSVTDQVPETKTYLFVKLPDRILLIDPDSKMVAEIVVDEATTGTGQSPASPGSTPR
jgi:hypothetical protein